MSRRDLLLALLFPVIWGIAFTLGKPATEHFPPLLLFTGVYAVVAVVFGLLYPGRFQTPFWPAFLVAALVGSVQAILIFGGLAGLDASVAVIVLQTQVPISVLADRVINGSRLTALQLVGVAIAFLGVVAIAGLPETPPPFVPLMLVLAGALVWAIGQALVRRIGRDPAPKLFALVGLHAAPQLLIGSLLLESGQIAALTNASAVQWGSLALLTILGFCFGNLTWYVLIERNPLARIAPFLLLMPIVGVIVSALVLVERLAPVQLVGGTVVLIGLAMVLGIGQRGRAGVTSQASERL